MELLLTELTAVSKYWWVLVATSYFASLLTACMGLGGGLIMLAVLLNFLPAVAVIPVHGAVQLGSNISRVALFFKHIHWSLVVALSVGGVAGVVLGGQVVVSLPEHILLLVLSIATLWLTWGKLKFPFKSDGHLKLFWASGGFVAGFATMFVGATGPLIMSIIKNHASGKMQMIGTHAFCLSIQHLFKLIVFGFLGFAFAEYAVLIACLLIGAFTGTVSGKLLLHRVPEKHFLLVMNLIITALALRMLWKGMTIWMSLS